MADAHAVLGYALGAYDWNFTAAERELRRALELDPNSASAGFFFGTFLCLADRTEDALTREFGLYFAHRYDDAIAP